MKNIQKENLMSAIGEIDEVLVEEANENYGTVIRISWKKWTAAAASVAAVFAIGTLGMFYAFRHDNGGVLSPATIATIATADTAATETAKTTAQEKVSDPAPTDEVAINSGAMSHGDRIGDYWFVSTEHGTGYSIILEPNYSFVDMEIKFMDMDFWAITKFTGDGYITEEGKEYYTGWIYGDDYSWVMTVCDIWGLQVSHFAASIRRPSWHLAVKISAFDVNIGRDTAYVDEYLQLAKDFINKYDFAEYEEYVELVSRIIGGDTSEVEAMWIDVAEGHGHTSPDEPGGSRGTVYFPQLSFFAELTNGERISFEGISPSDFQ
jgi:hypothetical protein